jgi:hypothetical protein
MSTPHEQHLQHLEQSEQARQDLLDISALGKVAGLERYFYRRIREKMERHTNAILYDDAMAPSEREFARQRLLELKELLTMLATDEVNLQKFLRQATT